jgi:hypothetical protein
MSAVRMRAQASRRGCQRPLAAEQRFTARDPRLGVTPGPAARGRSGRAECGYRTLRARTRSGPPRAGDRGAPSADIAPCAPGRARGRRARGDRGAPSADIAPCAPGRDIQRAEQPAEERKPSALLEARRFGVTLSRASSRRTIVIRAPARKPPFDPNCPGAQKLLRAAREAADEVDVVITKGFFLDHDDNCRPIPRGVGARRPAAAPPPDRERLALGDDRSRARRSG